MLDIDKLYRKVRMPKSDRNDKRKADLEGVQRKGYEHGLNATYAPDDVDISNPDWFLDVGADIERIETTFLLAEGKLFEVYCLAYAEGKKARVAKEKAPKEKAA